MNARKYWVGPPPKDCDVCDEPLVSEFSDVASIYSGAWAIICKTCLNTYAQHGRKYGTGIGQRYEAQPDGRWLKVEG